MAQRPLREASMQHAWTEWDRMLAGEPYDGAHEVFFAARAACALRKAALDRIPPEDLAGRAEAMKALFGAMGGPCLVQPPFDVEYGTQVRLGAWVFVNSGALFNDCAPITLGDHVTVGPRVMFLTASHPIRPEARLLPAEPGRMPPFRTVTTARPVTVERDVWIGAGAILLPGVTVGEGSVIGAGSVVTRSVPPRTVVAGNPARRLRSVDDRA
jgi:maltose O-acetyltransferase